MLSSASDCARKPILFVDCDGFLFNTIPAHVRYFHDRYGVTISESEFLAHPDLIELLRMHDPALCDIPGSQIFDALNYEFMNSWEYHQGVEPMPDMPHYLKLLDAYFEIRIVTLRSSIGKPVMYKLIEKYIPGIISEIHCVHILDTENRLSVISKREYISNHKVVGSAFGDDSLHQIETTHDIVPSILYDPYGAHNNNPVVRTGEITRARSWQGLYDFFMKQLPAETQKTSYES